jgi:hypothetical protein
MQIRIYCYCPQEQDEVLFVEDSRAGFGMIVAERPEVYPKCGKSTACRRIHLSQAESRQ